ncbi:MAG: NACHT domain-containing protein [Gammaproteobacteria bacterium]|nr:NACHT domain-containing protein [Gammaproteobacteria bacterium]
MIDALIDEFKWALQTSYQRYLKLPRLFSSGEKADIAESFINLALLKKQAVQEVEKKWGELYQGEKWNDERAYSHESLYQEHIPLPLDKLFLPENKKEKTPESVLVWGRAGIGKSILCQYLATQCGTSEVLPHLNQQFQAVIWLRLREIITVFSVRAEFSWEGDELFWQILKKYFLTTRFWKKEENEKKEILFEWMETNASHILILCDGYDEIAGLEKKYPWVSDLFETIFKMGRVLLTSRPMPLHVGQNRQFDRELECMGFMSDDIEHYVSEYLNNVKKEYEIPLLISFLRSQPSLWGIAHIPINLELICWSWKENKLSNATHTLSALYEEIVSALKERNEDDNKQPFPISSELKEHALAFLAKLADAAMQRKNVLFSRKFLNVRLKAYHCEHAKDVESSSILAASIQLGLLKSTGKVDGYAKTLPESYCFVHLSFQEFFAARYYMQHFLYPVQNKSEAILTECMQYKYEPQYQLMWWFLSGLLYQAGQNDSSHQAGLTWFWQALHTFPHDAIGTYHLALIAHCLEECEANQTLLELSPYLQQQVHFFITWLNDTAIDITNLWFLALTRCPNVLGRLIQENFSYVDLTRLTHLLQPMQFLPQQIQTILFERLTEEKTLYQHKIDIANFFTLKLVYLNDKIAEKLFEFLAKSRGDEWSWRRVADCLAGYETLPPSHLTILLEFRGRMEKKWKSSKYRYDYYETYGHYEIVPRIFEVLGSRRDWDNNLLSRVKKFLKDLKYSEHHRELIHALGRRKLMNKEIAWWLRALLLNGKIGLNTRQFAAVSLLHSSTLTLEAADNVWQFYRKIKPEEYNFPEFRDLFAHSRDFLSGCYGEKFVTFLSDTTVNVLLRYQLLRDLYTWSSPSEDIFMRLVAALTDFTLELAIRVPIGLLLLKWHKPPKECIHFFKICLFSMELKLESRTEIALKLVRYLGQVDELEEILLTFLRDIEIDNSLYEKIVKTWCQQKTISRTALMQFFIYFVEKKDMLYDQLLLIKLIQKSEILLGEALFFACLQNQELNSSIKIGIAEAFSFNSVLSEPFIESIIALVTNNIIPLSSRLNLLDKLAEKLSSLLPSNEVAHDVRRA